MRLVPALAVFLMAGPALAVPLQLAHQGRLLDAEQAPLDGSHDLTFRLYDAPLGGSLLWDETVTESFTAGFYATILGADAANYPLDDGLFATPPLYLELTVDDGEPLLPRQEINSVPYALRAGTAENVEGGYVDATEVFVDGDLVIDSSGTWVGPTPAVAWTDLSGVPTGLLDGQDADSLAALSCADEGIARYDLGSGLWVCGADAVLTSSDVLGFVNGATLAMGAGSTMNGSTLATFADLAWNSLAGVPGDLADGDADTLAGLSCINGAVAKFNLGTGLWDCANDSVLSSSEVLGFVDGTTLDFGVGSTVNGVTIATVADLDWSVLTSVPVGFLDGDDADTLATLGPVCADGDRAAWDSGLAVWTCAPEQVELDRLDMSAASSGQVLTFDGTNVAWEDPATTANPSCTLTDLVADFGFAGFTCGTAVLGLRTRIVFSQISAGLQHACGVAMSGTAKCWGRDSSGEAIPPPGGTYTQISAGGQHTCAVDSASAVQCWGRDDYGQSNPPAGTFTQVRAGAYHTCAIDGSGTLQCWGQNTYNQAVPPAGSFTQVSAGSYHSCALESTGSVQCWGQNNNGESTPPPGTFTQVSAGTSHTCAVESTGSVQCWGQNSNGQSTPLPGMFTQVSAGQAHTCALDSGGSVQCWGSNNYGESAPPAAAFTEVSAGQRFTCATMQTFGTSLCWGTNFYGQIDAP